MKQLSSRYYNKIRLDFQKLDVVETKKKEIRDALVAAFKLLRKEGIYARANLMCCTGCGCSSIGVMESNGKLKKYYGATFWHNQDEDGLSEGRDMWLTHSVLEGHDGKDVEVANHILSVLIKCGVPATWNGETSEKICINVEKTILEALMGVEPVVIQ